MCTRLPNRVMCTRLPNRVMCTRLPNRVMCTRLHKNLSCAQDYQIVSCAQAYQIMSHNQNCGSCAQGYQIVSCVAYRTDKSGHMWKTTRTIPSAKLSNHATCAKLKKKKKKKNQFKIQIFKQITSCACGQPPQPFPIFVPVWSERAVHQQRLIGSVTCRHIHHHADFLAHTYSLSAVSLSVASVSGELAD